MTPQLFEIQTELVVFGPFVRTSPATATQDIPALWQRCFQTGALQNISRSATDAGIYAVYCEYEKDEHAPYTMILGVPVAAPTPVDGFKSVRIAVGRYARFAVSGDPKIVISETWQFINQGWENRPARSYLADFERYDAATLTANYAAAEVVVGLR